MHTWVDELSQHNEMYRQIKDQLLKELEYVTDFLLQQTEKNLAGGRLIDKLQNIVNEKKFEIQCLRTLAMEM
jgi:hypothetical protein